MKNKLLLILILTTIFLIACGKSSSPKSAVSGNGAGIAISNYKFDPATITIAAGTTVTWTNQDSANHTVVANDGSWKSKSLAKGATFSFTFEKAGTFTYICSVHPTMKGTIIVQ